MFRVVKKLSFKIKIILLILLLLSSTFTFLVLFVFFNDEAIREYLNLNNERVSSDTTLAEGRKIYNINQELEETTTTTTNKNNSGNSNQSSTDTSDIPSGVISWEEYEKMNVVQRYEYIYKMLDNYTGGWNEDGVRKLLGTGNFKSSKRHAYTFLHFRDVIPAAIVEYYYYGIIASIPTEHSVTEAGWTYKENTTSKRTDLFSTKTNNYYGCMYSKQSPSPWLGGSVTALGLDNSYTGAKSYGKWAQFDHVVYSALHWGWMWTQMSRYKKYHVENYKDWNNFGIVVYDSGYGANGDKIAYNNLHKTTYKNYNLTKVDDFANTLRDQMKRVSAGESVASNNTNSTNPSGVNATTTSTNTNTNNDYVTNGGTVIDSSKEWTPYSITEEWGYPLDPSKGYFSSKAGMRRDPILHYNRLHSGIDYAAEKGIPVYVTKSGTVVQAGYQGERGKQVLVKHSGGWYTRYQHMTEITVKVGQTLNQGDQVGTVGNTGIGTGSHLHYEMLYDGYAQANYKNPEKYYNLKLLGKLQLKDGTSFKDYMQCIKDYGHYGKVTFNSSSRGSTNTNTNTNTNTGNNDTNLAGDYSSAISKMRSLSGSGSSSDPKVSVNTPGYSWIKTYDVNLSNISDERLAVLAEGSKYLGTPYKNPSYNTPNEFCCSHFTSWCYTKALGYTLAEIPTYSGSQKNLSVATEITVDQAKPGDLIWEPGHVMIFVKKLSNNRIVVMESTPKNYCGGTGTGVSSRPFNSTYKFFRLNKFKD